MAPAHPDPRGSPSNGLALPRGYWVTIGRAKSKRIARYDRVLADAQHAQSLFRAGAGNAPWSVYDIRAGVYAWTQKQVSGKADDAAESAAASTVRQVVQQWGTAAQLLKATTVGGELREWAPSFETRGSAILNGQLGTANAAAREISVDELSTMLSDLTNVAAVATYVRSLHELNAAIPRRVEPIGTGPWWSDGRI